MAKFVKGQSGNPKGKIKGTKNKVTRDMKKAFKLLVEDNLDAMQGWIDETAVRNPAEATKLVLDMSERFLPKLARTEHTGKDGEKLNVTLQHYGSVDPTQLPPKDVSASSSSSD